MINIAYAASIQESEPRLYMNAQTNLSHPWHQHWAETICCQQLSLLAQTLAPVGGARLKSQTKSENENGDEKNFHYTYNFQIQLFHNFAVNLTNADLLALDNLFPLYH